MPVSAIRIQKFFKTMRASSGPKLYPQFNTTAEGPRKEFFNAFPGKLLPSTIRELIQNSIDAKDKQNKRKNTEEIAHVKITKGKLDFSFLDKSQYLKVFKDCAKTQHNDPHVYNQMHAKMVDLDLSQLSVLSIEDNGNGIIGSSRFDNTENDWDALLGINESNKSGDDMGSFGIGKLTAIQLSIFKTVFYYSQYEGNQYFIGRTLLRTFKKDVEENRAAHMGPNYWLGREIKIHGNPEGDIINIKENPLLTKSKLRSLDEDGLSTIIPIAGVIVEDWMEEVTYRIIVSYFQKIKEGRLEISIKDISENKTVDINASNITSTILSLQDWVDNQEEIEYQYWLEIIKIYLGLNQDVKMFKSSIHCNVNKYYKGNIHLQAFYDESLADLAERVNNGSKSFRIIRRGMMIRKEEFPKRIDSKFSDAASICGYITFDGSLNNFIRELETQSHDEFIDNDNYNRKYEDLKKSKGFPSLATKRQKFDTCINQIIKQAYEQFHENAENQELEFKFEFDFENDISDIKGEKESYTLKPKIGKKESIDRGAKLEKILIDHDEAELAVSNYDMLETEDETTIAPGHRVGDHLDDDSQPSDGGPNRISSKMSSGNDVRQGLGQLKLEMKQKKINEKGDTHNCLYILELKPLNLYQSGKFDVTIEQDSIQGSRDSILTSKIQSITNNMGKQIKYDIQQNTSNIANKVIMKGIDFIQGEKNEIHIRCLEPTFSVSKFKIKH